MSAIKIEHVTKYYKPKNVIDDISFEVKEGEIFGLLGKNGAGKSTLINMMVDILQPTAGQIYIFGKPSTEIEVKQRIGVLPDYEAFYDSLNPVEHLNYFAKVNGKRVTREEIVHVLEQVGLNKGVITRKVKKFSFGMKKKLGIAQAIITDPDLIIFDEPTSGLDAEAVIQIQHLIRSLNARGKTIFMTSHNLDEIEKICTRIAILSDSNVMNIGTLNELRKEFHAYTTIIFKHLPYKQDQLNLVRNQIESMSEKVIWETEQTKVILQNEMQIPYLLKILVNQDIQILRMDVIEPSLEDIFLGGFKDRQLVPV
ncbi:ABC transporter ATP-binding protein [Oceanobacillus zhaokaii]|uniref:ABC transporter ATP-binding protein n=1 Tax=Oceanobacillus zhaokaii TaxID=2052660 RepID=A0A345PCE8_9BACI|nr:ABC transporter ATP-binding protein [Oceanobacillus zhaokaii]AXI07678.1 ABC transporter ATP-binding protein [Oceanobacillus zhaokaii]